MIKYTTFEEHLLVWNGNIYSGVCVAVISSINVMSQFTMQCKHWQSITPGLLLTASQVTEVLCE